MRAAEVCRTDAIERLARFGFAARGVLWMVVGGLAIAVVLGADERTDKEGALRAIAAQPGGEVAIIVLITAFLGYASWRGVMAAGGHRHEEGGKRTRKRMMSAARCAFYLLLAGSGVRFLVSGPRSDETPTWTARVMELPAGSQLVTLAGAVAVGVGMWMGVRAARYKHEKHIDPLRVPPRWKGTVGWIGTAGLTGRGVVIALIGGFLAYAGWQHDPQDARGLDAALKELAQVPLGRGLVALAAVGMLAYAAWSLCEAAFRDTER